MPDQQLSSLKNQLTMGLVDLGQNYSESKICHFIDYLFLLQRWNKAYNLTAITELNAMLTRHILDSLAVAPHLEGKRFIDVGTGAGLPGIPLAIACHDRNFDLIDSNGKKIRFLFQVRNQLGLKNVTEKQQRVERVIVASGYDGILSRAYASLTDMIQNTQHLLEPDGRFYALKGKISSTELELIPADYEVETLVSLAVPELNEERHLVIIKRAG